MLGLIWALGCDHSAIGVLDGAVAANRDATPLGDVTSLQITDTSSGHDSNGGGTDGTSLGDGGGDGLAHDAARDSTQDAIAVDHTVDTLSPDTTVDTISAPPGLSKPCLNGAGWTLFRFHYSTNSTSPSLDVWDAACSYSYAPNSACNVYAITPGMGSVSTTPDGYPVLTSSHYLRVRYSVAGLSFSQAALYIQARSYATSSSTNYEVWSPIYGGLQAGPVDNDWIYDWYGVDWSSFLSPSDSPGLTAIQIYAGTGSGSLALKAVELCVL